MKNKSINTFSSRVKPALTIGLSALVIAMALPNAIDFASHASMGLVSTAYADESSHSGGGGSGRKGSGSQGGGSGMKGSGSGSGSAQGHFSGTQFDGSQGKGGGGGDDHAVSEESEEDSDKPAWAGKDATGDKPGGGNKGGDSKKGGDYGDLWVMLRADDGSLIYKTVDGDICTAGGAGCYPVTIDKDGNEIILADDVEPTNTVEVEFGRLNIARSPSKVLDHALAEALSKLDGLVITSINIVELTDESGRLLLTDGSGNAIDSPLENLAIYKALLDGYTNPTTNVVINVEGVQITVAPDVVLQLAASALAASSDKTGTLEIDEVMYISGFLGVDDELSKAVEDFTAWYNPTDVYNINVEVLNVDTMTWDPVNLNTAVEFNTVNPITLDGNGIDVFTQAADDSVQVLEYVHDNTIRYPTP
jgi:hypothetical protein